MKRVPVAVRACLTATGVTLAGVFVGAVVGRLSGADLWHPTMYPFVFGGAIAGMVFSVPIMGLALMEG